MVAQIIAIYPIWFEGILENIESVFTKLNTIQCFQILPLKCHFWATFIMSIETNSICTALFINSKNILCQSLYNSTSNIIPIFPIQFIFGRAVKSPANHAASVQYKNFWINRPHLPSKFNIFNIFKNLIFHFNSNLAII